VVVAKAERIGSLYPVLFAVPINLAKGKGNGKE
jgi:hypothetical protein